MGCITWQDWQGWLAQGGYTILPVIKTFPFEESKQIASWQKAWEEASPYAFVLESGKSGRYHYLGLRPKAVMMGKADQATLLESPFTGSPKTFKEGRPFACVKEWMNAYRAPIVHGFPKFTGGIVGYWSYDVARSYFSLAGSAHDENVFPDYYFMMMDELWVIDSAAELLYCCVYAPVASASHPGTSNEAKWRVSYEQALQRTYSMKAEWDRFMSDPAALKQSQIRREFYDRDQTDIAAKIEGQFSEGLTSSLTREEFNLAVEAVQSAIHQGEVSQVNLSLKQSRMLTTDPSHIYEWLRLCNPSPYMGYLRFPEIQLISASPELFIRIEDGKLTTRPIAGTRPRGSTDEKDNELAKNLIYNIKERTEHEMLVELNIEDMEQVCVQGSVAVKEHMAIEYYSHVMHIVSEIEGTLCEDKDVFAVMQATFPGATITGTPKQNTIYMIEQLEPTRRGPYTGSMGWISFQGDAEFNIIIRTLIVDKDGHGSVQAGAGIVSASVPEFEYVESLNKAKGLWKAVRFSEFYYDREIGEPYDR